MISICTVQCINCVSGTWWAWVPVNFCINICILYELVLQWFASVLVHVLVLQCIGRVCESGWVCRSWFLVDPIRRLGSVNRIRSLLFYRNIVFVFFIFPIRWLGSVYIILYNYMIYYIIVYYCTIFYIVYYSTVRYTGFG